MKIIDKRLFDRLCEAADDDPRRRVHELLHQSHDDPVQRMVMAMQPGTYVRPHRHPDPAKWELLLVLRGAAAVLHFDDQGRVTHRVEAGAHRGAKGLETAAGTWHALVCLSADTVLFECKPGPFDPTRDYDFAAWAPSEGADNAGDCVRWMLRAEVGQRFDRSGRAEIQ
jgi:cupin fold WbuC family metalloprotein